MFFGSHSKHPGKDFNMSIVVTFRTEMNSVILVTIQYYIQVTNMKCKSKIGNYWKYYGKEKYTNAHSKAICKNDSFALLSTKLQT